MGKNRERTFTDEEVALLNNMVGAAVRILRNKEINVDHPEFQQHKRDVVNIVFGLWDVTSPREQEKLWAAMAARTESAMRIPPEEHFRRKRAKEIYKTLGNPEDEQMRELLDEAKKEISATAKRKKANALLIRDAVYKTIAKQKYASKKIKEATANELKYYLCIENGIPTSDPDLKSVSDPSRQKNFFEAV